MLPSGSRSPPASDAAQNRFVRTAHWSITGKCNYRCRHCYMSAPDAKLGEIDHDTMMDLARQIADCGILEVSLTGGEPLVRRDFMELVDALLSYRIRIAQIYTNGKLVDEKLLDQLEERGIRPEFNMSYDGTQGWRRSTSATSGVFPPEPRCACTRATSTCCGRASARWRRTIARA